MLEALFTTQSRELTLQYLAIFENGYAREISRHFDISLPSIQLQLTHLEDEGVLESEMEGRTKVYAFNPKYLFIKELFALLSKAREYYEPALQNKFISQTDIPTRGEV